MSEVGGPDACPTIRLEIERVSAEVVTAAREFPTATIHEAAGKAGALPAAIKPVSVTFRLCGPAVTVHCPAGDNLWIHRAYIRHSQEMCWLFMSAAHTSTAIGRDHVYGRKGSRLAGLVIDGCVRDGLLLEQIGFRSLRADCVSVALERTSMRPAGSTFLHYSRM